MLLCLVAAVGYAVGVVAQKPLLAPAAPRSRSPGWRAPSARSRACRSPRQLVAEAADARVSTLGWIVYLGAFPTAIAFTTWAYALSHTTAGRMGATTYLVPPVTILLAWLLLDESPAPLAFAGGALCLARGRCRPAYRKPRTVGAPS